MRTVRLNAFTLLELLTVISIIALLMGILVPALVNSREKSRQTGCAGHLAGIGQACSVYAGEWGTFPLQPPPTAAKFGKWTYQPLLPAGSNLPNDPVQATYTGGPVYPEYGDPIANFWLLVLVNYASPKQFVCPSDPKLPTPADIYYHKPIASADGTFLNFGAYQGQPDPTGRHDTISYSFAYPWTGPLVATPPAWWRANSDGGTPIVADIGPSMNPPLDDPTATPGSTASNSKNHGGTGQNVLFSDGHVEFEKQCTVGPRGDNIYTADSNTIYVAKGGSKFNTTTGFNIDTDVVLVPARP